MMPGTSAARVVVGVHRVVDEAGVHLVVVQRAGVTHPLVGTPLGAGEDLRLAGVAAGLERDLAVAGLQRLVGDLVGDDVVLGLVALGGVELAGVDRRLLDGRVLALAGLDDGHGHVVGDLAVRRHGLGLHLVDVADQQRVGAGTRLPALRAVGVGAVLLVVLDRGPRRSTCRRCGCGPGP